MKLSDPGNTLIVRLVEMTPDQCQPTALGGPMIETTALNFALLIDSAPELTEDVVTAAYLGAEKAKRARDDGATYTDTLAAITRDGGVVKERAQVRDGGEVDLATALGSAVQGGGIVRPGQPADAGALSIAVDRFVTFARRLPHLGTWDDRQAVWNLLGGTRPKAAPSTECDGSYSARSSR